MNTMESIIEQMSQDSSFESLLSHPKFRDRLDSFFVLYQNQPFEVKMSNGVLTFLMTYNYPEGTKGLPIEVNSEKNIVTINFFIDRGYLCEDRHSFYDDELKENATFRGAEVKTRSLFDDQFMVGSQTISAEKTMAYNGHFTSLDVPNLDTGKIINHIPDESVNPDKFDSFRDIIQTRDQGVIHETNYEFHHEGQDKIHTVTTKYQKFDPHNKDSFIGCTPFASASTRFGVKNYEYFKEEKPLIVYAEDDGIEYDFETKKAMINAEFEESQSISVSR